MMTKEDLHRRITEVHEDAEEYERLAEEHPAYHGILHDMAQEERCHAKHLEYILAHME